MKHAKKIISMILTLAMLLSFVPAFSLQAKAEAGRVTVGVAKAEGSMDLTEMGNADWMHFTGTGATRKAAPGSNGDSIDFLNPNAGDGRTFGQQNDQVWRWQSFKSDIGGELKKLEVALYRNGSPSDVLAKLYKAVDGTWVELGSIEVPEAGIEDRKPLALDFGAITIEPGVFYAVAMSQKVLNNTTNQWMWCNSETGFPNGKIMESGEWKVENTAASLRVTIGEPKTVGIIDFEMFGGMTMDYTMTDSAVEYSWSDGIPNQTASNVRTGGVFHYQDGWGQGEVKEPAGWKLTIPASDTLQTLTFVSGVMNASFEIDIYANGDKENPVYQNKELSATEPSKLLTYTVTIAPNTAVEVCANLTNKHTVWGNASLCAVTLNREQKASAVTVEVAGANGEMNLTELGTTDWVHFTSERIDRKAAQNGEAGGEIIDFLNPNASNGRTFGQQTDQWGRWQSFMSTTGGPLTKLEVAVYRQGNPSDLQAGLFKAQTDGTWALVNSLITIPVNTIEDRKPLALDFGSVAIEPNVYYAVVLCQATPSQSDNWMWCNAETSFPNGKILETGAWVVENTAASLRVTVGTPATETVGRIAFDTIGGMTMDSTMNDSAALYSWTDGIPTKSASGVKTGGVLNYKKGEFEGKLDETAAWKLSVPASSSIQTLTFVSGVWMSSCEIYIYVNGDTENPVYSNKELTAGGTSKLLTYTVTVAPDTSVEVYGKMTEKSHSYGNMSLCAAALSESAVDPSHDYIALLREAVKEGEELLEDDLDDYFKNQLEAALRSAKAALAKEDLTQSEAYSEYVFLMTAISAAKNAPMEGNYANVYASGAVCSFGWEGDKDAPILWVDGTYLLRDNGGKVVTFGVSDLNSKSVKWYNKEGYLPCFVSEYEKDGLKHTIENFADLVVIDGKNYEVAYSRMTTTNLSDTEKRLPRVSVNLVGLNDAASQKRIAAGETVVRDYCIGADRFGGTYAYPEDAVLAQQGSWDSHYEHMRTYWNDRLDGIVKITSVPEEYSDLINAYKAGYIYTLIIADGYELHVGENGYDRVFDHDVIGMLATLIEAGHTEHFADYAQYILLNIQYPDAAWKFSWPFALYLEKTGDYDTVLSFFEDQNGKAGIKTNTRKIAAEREVQDETIKDADGKTARIMKMTNAIDSNGKWTIDNWAALFGLTTYKYLCDKLSDHAATETDKAYYKAESDWAAAEYEDLLKSVEAVLKNTMEKYGFNYIPISMILPNELTERSNLGDGNWAAHYLFGRWNWDGYLFGADQDSWLLGLTDTTYDYIIEQKSQVLPSPYTMGGYPGYSSAYNAGYYSAALTGEKWRDGGIKAYQWMIDNAQSSPFGWWESINWPNTNSPWEEQQCDGGGSSQHMWGQSVATKILIDSFLAEKADGSIIAGRGLPAEWNAAGEKIEIKDWLCNSGKKIGFTMESAETYIDFTLTGDKLENSVSLELLALKNNIRKVEGEGCTFDREKGTVLIPAGTTSVRILLGQPVAVTGVELDKTELTLLEEETAQLTATVLPADAENKNVTWTSSDDTVAAVDENGLVTAVSAGQAVITVTTEDGGKTASCEVTVKSRTVSVTGVKLNRNKLELVEGEEADLIAEVLPENATNQKVRWMTTDAKVARVDENGHVTAVSKGEAIITVITEDGEKSDFCVVTVTAKETPVEPILPIEPGKPVSPSKPGSGSSAKKFPFTDVSKYDECYDAVKYLYENDIMNGTSDTLFSPNAELTRGMVVTILYRMEGEPFTTGAKTFSDVASNRYYSKAVQWAAENDIVNGYTDGTFKPDQAVTREQLAAIIRRYADFNGIVIYAPDNALASTDVVSNWAKNDVAWAAAEGILSSAQTANATKNATRAEVAMAIYTYLTKTAK